MTAGRCPGCGLTLMSCKKVRDHMLSCEPAAKLYQEDPTRSMDPEEEYERYHLEEVLPAKDKKQEDYEKRRVAAKKESQIAIAEMNKVMEERRLRQG